MMRRWLLYWHTVRHLRVIQIVGRLWYRFYRPAITIQSAPAIRVLNHQWRQPARRAPSLTAHETFCFLNEQLKLNDVGWNGGHPSKLWRYNQHYFDDLNAEGAEEREEWHRALLDRWVRENPPGKGNGWEPYPTSLRVVNWIQWLLMGHEPARVWLDSLATQVRWLRKHLEFHILGNHLSANAKALVFAGCFFKGDEAERWLRKGLALVERELSEQVLADGGHFERSPMYHLIAFEDVLDLRNILSAYQGNLGTLNVRADEVVKVLDGLIPSMWRWLEVMRHPDDGIAFFNDAAFGIAPTNQELRRYASELGFVAPRFDDSRSYHLEESGYVRAYQGAACLVFDAGPIGPDYLPGHAHADTLSFELNLGDQRLFVNSGTSEYGTGEERQRQRSTAAHNTIEINGADSSEVWSGFRVARRACPFGVNVQDGGTETSIRACHDGYERLRKPVRLCRSARLTNARLVLSDEIIGKPRSVVARFHCHPSMSVCKEGEASVQIQMPNGQLVTVQFEGADSVRIVKTTWHPRFGESWKNRCIEVHVAGDQLHTCVEWGNV